MTRHQQTADHCLAAAKLRTQVIESANWNEFDHQQILAAQQPECETMRGFKTFLADQPRPRFAFIQLLEKAIERWQSADMTKITPKPGKSSAGELTQD